MSAEKAADPTALKELLKTEARALGFDLFGITTAASAERADYLRQWVAEGRHGGMEWMARDIDRRIEAERVLPGAQSILCVGLNYYQSAPQRRGTIATYALGGDYHKLMANRLKRLCEILRANGGANRPYADTGPILEKPLSQRAGLGWQGRNSCIVNERIGNWTFLGVILTTLALPVDAPSPNRCGTCSRCQRTCPTNAIIGERVIDARRCISYLTIEHKGPIPEELRPLIGDHFYGCDECLSACPWSRRAPVTKEERFAPRPMPDPAELLSWDEAKFDEAAAGMALKRTGFERMKRNACVVLGNIGVASDLPALQNALNDTPLVAEHAAWAIRRIEERMKATITT
jgi:epoxyqueuosine reductase